MDNIFPHHTNEIAQTEGFVGHKWCNYWFHVNRLNAGDGEKMSKSLGNVYTITQLAQMGYNPMVYKLFNFLSHYRNQLAFSLEGMDAAKNTYNKLLKRIAGLAKTKEGINKEAYDKYYTQFADALSNDLNTSLAITTVFDVLKAEINDSTKVKLILKFDEMLNLGFTDVINNGLPTEEIESDLRTYIETQIEKRNEAKKNRDFALADKIRAELSEKGIELVDTKEGTKYHKK